MAKKISFTYDLTEEYITIGISSHLKEYKLCWYINQILKINLSKFEDFSLERKNSGKENFSFFYCNDNNTRINFFFVANKNQNMTLLEKIPEADFLLMIKGNFVSKKITDLTTALKKVNNVLTVFQVNMASVKEMNLFLTELELHLADVLKVK